MSSPTAPAAADGGPAGPGRRDRPRRLRWLLGVAIGLVLLLGVGLLSLRQPPVATRLVNGVLGRLTLLPRAGAGVREVRGDWLTGLEVYGLRIARGDTVLVAVDTLRARYSLASLLVGRIEVRELEIAGVLATADLADTSRPEPKSKQPPLGPADLLRGRFYGGPALRVDRVILRNARYGGRAGAPDSGFARAALRARGVRLGRGFAFDLDSLELRGPRGTVFGAAATLRDGRFELRSARILGATSDVEAHGFAALGARDTLAEAGLTLRAQPLALAELEPLVPGFRLDGIVLADADLHGTRADRLSGTLAVSVDRGRFGALEFGPSRIGATVTEGRAELDGDVRYEGARAELSGWIRPLDATPSYDVQLAVDRLPARVPGAPWWAPMAQRAGAGASLRVRGSGYARAVLQATGRVDGDAGRIDLDGGLDLTRGLAWQVKRIAFDGLDLARLAGDTVTSAIDGTLTAAGASEPGGKSRLVAALDLAPSHYGEMELAGARVRASMAGPSLGASLRLEAAAGRLEVDSLFGRWDRVGRFRAVGARFHDLDLERVTRQPALASRLEGTMSLEGRGLAALGEPGGPLVALREGRLSGEGRVELAASRFRGQDISSGFARLELTGGAVEATADLASSAGRIDLDAHTRPFDSPPVYTLREARFANLDLGAWAGSPGLRSSLTGALTARGHPAGAGGGDEWNGTLRLDPSRFRDTELTGGQARGSWSAGRAELIAELRTARDTASVHGMIVPRDSVPHGRVEASIPFRLLATLMGRDSLPSRGGLEARVTFVGLSPATATAEGEITGRGAIDRARLDSLRARFRLHAGTLELDTLAVLSNLGTVTGAGRVALDSAAAFPTDLRLAAAIRDLSPLRALIGADTLAVGSANLDLRLAGPATARRVETRADLRSLAWNDLRVIGAEASANATLDSGWRPTQAEAAATVRRLQRGGVAIREGSVRATLADGEAGVDLTAALDDRHQAHVVGRGRADTLGTHITLTTLDVRSDSASWALTRPARIDLGPGRVRVEDFEARSRDGRIAAHGAIDRRGDQDFRIDLRGVDLDVVSAWLGRENVSGRLDGAFALEGPAAAPRGRADLHLDLVSDGHPAGTLRSGMSWNEGRLDLAGRFATPDGDSLAWGGHLPFALSLAPADSASQVRLVEGDVDVRLAADGFPLKALAPLIDPRVVGAGLDGTLSVDARLKGQRRALVGSGHIDVIDATVPLPGTGATYQDLGLHAGFEGNRLLLRRAHAVSAKGTLDATGEIRFVSVTQVEPKLNVRAKHFVFVDTPDLRAMASADLDVTGSVVDPVIKGKVTVENSNFTLVQSDLAASAPQPDVRLTDADIRMMEENFGYVKTPGTNAALQLYDASNLDLAITLERNNWLRQRVQPKLAVALTGQFQLRKAPHGEPELFGRIEPIPGRGFVEQFARSFDIAGGEVLLNGKMKDHRIDIQAQYKPSSSFESSDDEVVVNLDVEGTAEKLSLTLSSEPAMSEAEIVNFIVTGHSAADKSSASSSSSESSLAMDIGLSAVSGPAEQIAQEKIGLDVMQVRFDALQGATLVAGRYVDAQLYVGFRQPLQYKDNGAPNSETTNRTSVEVEYAIHRWLVLNLQGETSKLRSFFRARYAY